MTSLLERPLTTEAEAPAFSSQDTLHALEEQWEAYYPGQTEAELGLVYTELEQVPTTPRHKLFVMNETVQPGNNFKSNGMRWKVREELRRNPGVETFYIGSAGNAGAALVAAAEAAGKMVVVETPTTLVDSKRSLLETPLSEVNADHDSVESATAMAQMKADADPTGVYVHPYDDLEAIAGQGLVAMRALAGLFQKHEAGQIDLHKDNVVFLVQRGGGSLLTGTACAVQYLKQVGYLGDNVQVLEVRPQASVERYDGLNVSRPGCYAATVMADNNFVQGTVQVNEVQTGQAANRMARKYGKKFEPSGLAGVAAFEQLQYTEEPTVFVSILSGSNVAAENYEYFRDAPRRAETDFLRNLGGRTLEELLTQTYATPTQSIFHHDYGRHAIKKAV